MPRGVPENKEEFECDATYPVAIIEDRFSGSTAGGRWIAVAQFDCVHERRKTRFDVVYEYAHDRDLYYKFKREFGDERWVAAGNTPNQAVENVWAKMAGGELGFKDYDEEQGY